MWIRRSLLLAGAFFAGASVKQVETAWPAPIHGLDFWIEFFKLLGHGATGLGLALGVLVFLLLIFMLPDASTQPLKERRNLIWGVLVFVLLLATVSSGFDYLKGRARSADSTQKEITEKACVSLATLKDAATEVRDKYQSLLNTLAATSKKAMASSSSDRSKGFAEGINRASGDAKDKLNVPQEALRINAAREVADWNCPTKRSSDYQ